MHPNKLLREARLRISSLVISARSMQTPMTELACTSLLMARGHYGELLGQTSQAVSPYAFEEARREAGVSTEIAPEAERAERAFPLSGDMVADLDAIRRELEDLEIVTPHYRGAHAAAKARSGFRQYRSGGVRLGGRGRGRGRPFDPRVAEEVLS